MRAACDGENFAVFGECMPKGNAKHTLRFMKEDARPSHRNGALLPIDYRIVVAEQRGAKTKKFLGRPHSR